MKKIIGTFILLIAMQQAFGQNCVYCPQEPVSPTGSNIGPNTEAAGSSSIAMGVYSTTTSEASNSFAMGVFVKSTIPYNFVIGTGVNSSNYLVNNIQRSLMIGFGSTKPTFFVSTSPTPFTTGRIGIGNITAPEAKLHIRADAGEDADLFLEPTGENQTAQIRLGQNNSISAQDGGDMRFETETGQAFVFENGNIGIGNSQPQAKLHISGNMQVGNVSQPQNVRIYGDIIGSGASSFGYGNNASGGSSNVIGFRSEANAQGSIAIGKDLVIPSQFPYNIAIGSGYSENNKLINSFGPSLIVGFGSNIHTFIVNTAPSNGKTGRVGIGNIPSPQSKLHIRADEDEDATILLESIGSGKHSRMYFTGEHHITASIGDDFRFRTTDEKNFVFQNGDIFMEDINTGIIMKSPNGQCWRGTLTDQGMLNFVQATCPDFTSTGSELLQQNSHMRVFPNPASNSITVETSLKGQQGMLLLVSPDGTQLSRQKISADKTTLNMAWLVTGTYLIQLEINGQVVESTKVVKQ
jgi:hypothetical protein